MGRGNEQAQDASKSALASSGALQSRAGGLYNTLSPAIMNDITHPAGFSPTDLAAQNTAAQQSAGGSQAGAVGQGALLAARTKNAGAADAGIAESSRESGRALTDAALQTQVRNAMLKNAQRESALGMGTGLYGTNVGGSNNALGEVAQNVDANTNAENASWNWAKNIFTPIATSGIEAYGRIMAGRH